MFRVKNSPKCGIVFSDRIEMDFLEFNSGAKAVIRLSEKKGAFVIYEADMEIAYVKGDTAQAPCEDAKVIAHLSNDIGGRGRGFAMANSNHWPQSEQRDRSWHRGEGSPPLALGAVQFVVTVYDL